MPSIKADVTHHLSSPSPGASCHPSDRGIGFLEVGLSGGTSALLILNTNEVQSPGAPFSPLIQTGVDQGVFNVSFGLICAQVCHKYSPGPGTGNSVSSSFNATQ